MRGRGNSVFTRMGELLRSEKKKTHEYLNNGEVNQVTFKIEDHRNELIKIIDKEISEQSQEIYNEVNDLERRMEKELEEANKGKPFQESYPEKIETFKKFNLFLLNELKDRLQKTENHTFDSHYLIQDVVLRGQYTDRPEMGGVYSTYETPSEEDQELIQNNFIKEFEDVNTHVKYEKIFKPAIGHRSKLDGYYDLETLRYKMLEFVLNSNEEITKDNLEEAYQKSLKELGQEKGQNAKADLNELFAAVESEDKDPIRIKQALNQEKYLFSFYDNDEVDYKSEKRLQDIVREDYLTQNAPQLQGERKAFYTIGELNQMTGIKKEDWRQALKAVVEN